MRSIVQVTLWDSPYLGNFMSSQLALARAVHARFGFATHFVLAPGARDKPWLAELESDSMSWSILPSERDRWRTHLDEVLDAHAAALVHTHFTGADIQGAAAASAAGVPCVWHIHTGFNGYPLRQRAKDLIKFRVVARRRVGRIVAVSPWLAELTRRRGGPAERIEVVPNAIVVERFAQLPDPAAARERFGLDADADVVLALGWWPEIKGVDVLVDALERLAPRHPRLQALLVGEDQMRSFLAERLTETPSWLRLSRFVDDARWLYAAADIFVSASRHEGQPAAIGEALVCGLPVVMSDIAGSASWAQAPVVSMFPTEDATALAAALEAQLAESRQTRARAGARNRLWVHEAVGVDTWCERICRVYDELVGPA